MPKLQIRPASIKDCGLILHFIRELAEYEQALDEVVTSEDMLEKALFGESPRAHAVICEINGNAAGFALYFYNYSTWTGKYGLFLEDLYVSREHRTQGAGKALLKHLANIAIVEDCGRFEWNVLDWNEPAIRFYESFSAQPQNEWVGYRMTGDALVSFAAS